MLTFAKIALKSPGARHSSLKAKGNPAEVADRERGRSPMRDTHAGLEKQMESMPLKAAKSS
jgi:hypothetical protein